MSSSSAQNYWDTEGLRLLDESGTSPSIEYRVKHAWNDGFASGIARSAELEDELERERRDNFLERASLNDQIAEQKYRIANLRAELSRKIL